MTRSGTVAAILLGAACSWGCGATDPAGHGINDAGQPTDESVAATVATPGEGSGTVGHVTGTAPPAAEGTPSIIFLESSTTSDAPVPAEPAEMDQFGREFFPRLLLVRKGQPVVFLNSEDELHTVHVADLSGHSLFNVAMPIRGGRHDHTFSELGEYAVSCDAHNEMAATILVVDTPYAAIADRDGAFSFSNVPVGSYTAALRRGEQRHRNSVEITAGQNDLTLAFP